MKEHIPDAFPEGGLIENRDGLIRGFYEAVDKCIERSWKQLSTVEMVGVLDTLKFNILRRSWHDADEEDDE